MSDVTNYIVPNVQPFICRLQFEKSAKIVLTSGDYVTVSNNYDFMSQDSTVDSYGNKKYARGGFKWDRNLNKNAVYVQLPVGDDVSDSANPSNEGGYGYDLGFVQDNFVLQLQTTNYLDYQRFMALVKTNTGEAPATLTIGYQRADPSSSASTTNPQDTETFKVLVRYCNVSSNPGSQVMTMNVTLTVVSSAYT